MDNQDSLTSQLNDLKQFGSAAFADGKVSMAAMALVGVGALVVAGVSLARHEYNKHQSEKHLAKVKEILELYNEYLVDIPGTGLQERSSLPPPFLLNDKGKPTEATALKLNTAIRNDLIRDKSVNTDAFLNQYSHHIQNAKIHLVSFYDARLNKNERNSFTQGKEDDVTSSVLTYLLVMLSEHCTKFEGYQADIAYLEAIIRFTNAYASLPRQSVLEASDPKKRQRFERLKQVCKELRQAKKLLIDHSHSRTLKSFVDELMSLTGKSLIPDLSRLFAKCIVPEKEWSFIDAATLEVLADGLVRQEYHNTHTILHQDEIKIPDSIFKEWLQSILVNYLNPQRAIEKPLILKDEHLTHLRALFKLCQNFLTLKSPQTNANGRYDSDKFVPVGFDKECYLEIASQLPVVFEPDTFLLIKECDAWKLYEVKSDRSLEELCLEEVRGLREALVALPQKKPFQLLSKNKQRKVNAALTLYRNHQQLKTRAQVFWNLAVLLEQLSDLKCYCEKLSDCIRDLGEIYVNNPAHCNFIFYSLNELGVDLINRIGIILKALSKVEEEQDHANDMLIKKQLDLATRMNSTLVTIREQVSINLDGILDKHHVHSKYSGDPQAAGLIDYENYERDKKKMAIQDMLLFVTKITLKYEINTSKYELSSAKKMLARSNSSYSISEEKAELVPAHREYPEEDKPIDPSVLLSRMRHRIDELEQEEKLDRITMRAYERLYDALSELDLRAILLQKEKEPLRRAKGEAIKGLGMALCKKTLVFLNYDQVRRVREATLFRNDLQNELLASNTPYLDDHKSDFGKIARASKELVLCLLFGFGFYVAKQRGGFFRTNSRAAAHRVGESCKNLTTSLLDDERWSPSR